MCITLADALLGQIRVLADQGSKLLIRIGGCRLQRYPFFKVVSCLVMYLRGEKYFPLLLLPIKPG